MTTAQHKQIFDKVKSMMWTDPADILAKHCYLLEEDFQLLGEGTSGERQQWIDSMENGAVPGGPRPFRKKILGRTWHICAYEACQDHCHFEVAFKW